MAIDVTSVVLEMLSSNRGPDPTNPDHRIAPNYGITADLEDDTLNVVLTFRAASAYCCMEWGCHLLLFDDKRWEKLRRGFDAHGIVVPPQLKLRLSCLVEDGALFFDFSRPDMNYKGWYAFKPAARFEYQVKTLEAVNGKTANRRST